MNYARNEASNIPLTSERLSVKKSAIFFFRSREVRFCLTDLYKISDHKPEFWMAVELRHAAWHLSLGELMSWRTWLANN